MARIYQRTGKNGSIWYLDYLHEGRRFRKRCGHSKRLAEVALADITVKLERKELGFAPKDKNLAAFIEEYLNYAKSNKTEQSLKRDMETLKHFNEYFQVDRLSAISAPKLEAYKAWRKEKGVKGSTINRELNTIKAMLNKAVAWNYLSKNPAQTVLKFREPQRQVRFLSAEEISQLLEASGERLRLIIATLLYTGLRRDELVHLTWEDIDFEKKLLAVQAKDGWHPKDYEVRHIPLGERISRWLSNYRRSQDSSDFIFSTPEGGKLIGNLLSRDFRLLTKRCGVKRASVHTLRHSFASHLVMNGVDLYTVQKLLGHSSIKTTEIYAHLAPDFLRSAITKLDFKLPQKPAMPPLLTR